jgi:hypothetical protein
MEAQGHGEGQPKPKTFQEMIGGDDPDGTLQLAIKHVQSMIDRHTLHQREEELFNKYLKELLANKPETITISYIRLWAAAEVGKQNSSLEDWNTRSQAIKSIPEEIPDNYLGYQDRVNPNEERK